MERNFGDIVSCAPTMERVFKSIEMVAATDSTVLILGETGTGKELIARAMHRLSKRRDSVMVKVNCGALPVGLAESELFGHERGAFTGAVQQKKGRFELANHGTLFPRRSGRAVGRHPGEAAARPAGAGARAAGRDADDEGERQGDCGNQPRPARTSAPWGVPRRSLLSSQHLPDSGARRCASAREDVPLLAKHFVACVRSPHGQVDRADRGQGAWTA